MAIGQGREHPWITYLPADRRATLYVSYLASAIAHAMELITHAERVLQVCLHFVI